MTQPLSGEPIEFHAATIQDAIKNVLNHLLAHPDREGDGALFTLVFAGEAATVEGALHEAICEIRDLTADHGGIPLDIAVDAVVKTDIGTRIWGTISCVAGRPAITNSLPMITIHHEEPGIWTLTLGRN
jgi:hypothetical protein